MQPPACRADGDAKQQPLALAAFVLRRERGVEGLAQPVEQDRILAGFLRKNPLGEAWQERDVEGATSRLLDRADEDTSIAIGGWRLGERRQLVGEHIPNLAERDGP